MNIKICIVLLICTFCINTFAQTDENDIIVGKRFTLKSEALKAEREIQVFLPNSYKNSDKNYPVLYVLDGQLFFLNCVNLQNTFVQYRETPEFIVIGIPNKRSERNRNFRIRAKEYSEFIEKDVISFVDKTFRTTKKRMIFGWAFGGSFAIQTMLDKPKLFDAYIVASPFPISNKISQLDDFFAKNEKLNKSLYFTVGENEENVSIGTNALSTLLKTKAPKTLNWNYRQIKGESHRSTPYATIYHGIRKYFFYYPELQFNSLAQLEKTGGMKYVYAYQKRRAEEYGLSPILSDWTKFTIVRSAIRANDFKQFESFLTEFKGLDFISKLRLSRAISIADFYVENKHYDKAITTYTLLSKKHPKSELPLKKLGDVYSELKKKTKAEKFYKKAKEISETDSN